MSEKKVQNKDEKTSGISEVIGWIKTIVVAILFAIFINNFIIVNATIPTGSMENTIMPKDRIIASRLSYYWGSPSRGDIAIFKFPDDESILFVKRVIGLPGETVEIKDGDVFINGIREETVDLFIKDKTEGNHGPYEVPEGCYFMMGDNRNNSKDSREWDNKYVEEDKVLGKVYFKYFPRVERLE